MTDEPVDRRDFLRVPFNTEVEVKAGARVIRSNKGINISMSGLHFSSDEPAAPPGTPCHARVILSAPGHRLAIEADGSIIRSEPGSLTVEFTGLDLDSYHHLRQLILNNTDDPEKAEQEFIAHWGIRRPAQ